MQTRKVPFVRRAAVLVAVLAMMLQSFVVQTHVHRAGEAGFISAIADDTAGKAAPAGKAPADKIPANDDPANCPLCQEFGHNGAFVAPTAAVLALPFYIHLSLIVFHQPAPAVRALSHAWQGRAPPSA
jgi:hypothetical protein